MRALIAALFLISSCSGEKEILINPQPKTLEEGTTVNFLLDSEKSSKFVSSGEMEVKLLELAEDSGTFKASVSLDTKFGPQNVEITQKVSSDLLTLDFLGKLRAELNYENAEFKMKYVTMTLDACDVFKIYEMTQYKGVEIEATLCIGSGKVPSVKVGVDMYGIPVSLFFVQID